MRKTETVDLKGKDYATVPARIKEFRTDCPNGLIETFPQFLENGKILFKARILKDKNNPDSGEGTGHSLGDAKADKNFEKLETISVGRALAMLGYMASGEIASSEEMEEFMEYQKTKQEEELDMLKIEINAINTLSSLKEYWDKNKGRGKDFATEITRRKAEIIDSIPADLNLPPK